MLLLLLALLAVQPSPPADDFPPRDEFARRVRAVLRLDYELQKDFTYLERRRDVKISRLGKVSIGPLRTFEVYPSDKPGGTYKRLIEVDGKPLTAEEQARRDAERQQDLRREDARAGKESPQERAERRSKAEEEHRHRLAMVEDALAVFQASFVGRERIEGRPVLVAEITPREHAEVRTREGGWMKRFRGRLWVDAVNYQVVKLDMQAFEDITIGWGIVGRLHTGSRLQYVRRLVGDVWLPAELTLAASGRTLLFRPFEFSVTTTYWNYKRRSSTG